MKKMIFIFFIIFLQTNLQAQTLEERAICGEKPQKQNDAAYIAEAKRIEKTMPPVTNQNPAEWCYAFAASDSVNYYNYVQSNIQKGKIGYNDFYKPENLVSPIDAVHASVSFHDSHSNVSTSGRLDMKKGGINFDVFAGIQQMSYKMRSLEQISFDSNEETNPATLKFVSEVVEAYKSKVKIVDIKTYDFGGITCPAAVYESPILKAQLSNFRQINSWLSDTALANKLQPTDHIIDNYKGISDLKGAKDLQVYPFVNNEFIGNNTLEYLKMLRIVLYPPGAIGSPAVTNICANDLNLKAAPSDKCAKHSVNVVGAFYENGQCVVRIRNTWGKTWNGDGHISMPIKNYLATLQKFKKAASLSNAYNINWISAETEKLSKPRTALFKDGVRTVGVSKRTYNDKENYLEMEWINSHDFQWDLN